MSVDLARILNFVRSRDGATRLEISTETGMGRAAVIQRLNHLTAAGMLVEGPAGPSTGGRAPRPYLFAADRGRLLTAAVGRDGYAAGISDLGGTIIASERASLDFGLGPEEVLGAIEEAWQRLLLKCAVPAELLWGAGLGLPGSIDVQTGRPLSVIGAPEWDRYDVAGRLERKFGIPCWIDNDANVLALGEARAGAARGAADAIVVKVATDVRAGLITGGELHRGSGGMAGDIAHVPVTDDPGDRCSCGRIGCLGVAASGVGLRRRGTAAAADGTSPYLQSVLTGDGVVGPADVLAGAAAEDAVCVRLVEEAGHRLGDTVATLVDFFDPEIVVLGGAVAESGPLVAAGVRDSIHARSNTAVAQGLRVVPATLRRESGLTGAAHLAAEALLAPACFRTWFTPGDPRSRPTLAAVRRQLPQAG